MTSSSVNIVAGYTDDWLPAVRELFQEYADWLGFDLSFQQFDQELAALPGDYVPPSGRLFLALVAWQPAGCIALRPFENDICEMKRLYVRPGYRGIHLGLTLAERVIDQARSIGYKCMRLDTLPSMKAANMLYENLGFVDTAPYRHNPMPGARYMELQL